MLLGFCRKLTPIGIITLAFSSSNAIANTPSDVFLQTERAMAEVNLILKKEGAAATTKKVGVQKKKSPAHVFGKCIEVMEKVARLQEKVGVPESAIPSLPFGKVTPAQVYGCTETVISGLDTVKAKLGIADKIAEPAPPGKKTPSHVYRNMWQLSYMLDPLVGQLSPSEVFRNVKAMEEELALIAKNKSVSFTGSAAAVSGKKPGDVLVNCFKGLTLLKKVQRKLDVQALKVPKVPSGDIKPSDVYDCTNMQLTELHFVKVKLGIHEPRASIAEMSGKTPSDVFAEMDLYRAHLEQLLAKL